MNTFEMEGFLRGKCLPGDLLVGESNAAYLVRKLNEATTLKAERDVLEQRVNALAVTCSFYREAISKARRLINVGEMGDADDVLAKAERELLNTDAALAAIEARVWAEAKDLAKSMLASDSADHIDLLFDGKIQQLREAK